MRKRLYLIMLAAVLSWVAVAEAIDGNFFLAINTLLAVFFVIASPCLFVIQEDDDLGDDPVLPNARLATPFPASVSPVDAYRAGVDATELER